MEDMCFQLLSNWGTFTALVLGEAGNEAALLWRQFWCPVEEVFKTTMETGFLRAGDHP